MEAFIATGNGNTSKRRGERVYFIQAGDGGPIKIGRAVDVIRRLHGLQAASWEELRLLSATGAVTEREMHQRFASLRIRGEWFKPSVELLELIGSFPSTFRSTNADSSF